MLQLVFALFSAAVGNLWVGPCMKYLTLDKLFYVQNLLHRNVLLQFYEMISTNLFTEPKSIFTTLKRSKIYLYKYPCSPT